MIDPRARVGFIASVRDYRDAERRHKETVRRVERAARNLERAPARSVYVVELAVARSAQMTAAADLAALRDALKLAQRAGR